MTTESNNKRIAKNTLLLYFRMLLTVLISLYTVRIVLNTLGVVDYGIYNVVGGIVIMLSFLSNSLASASERFFAYEIGRKDIYQLKKTFSVTIISYLLIALFIFIVSETIGLLFLYKYVNIPIERFNAAIWVYQFSILSFLITIVTIPYNAAIIAHENMKVYAYVSILEVTVKLVIVYLLVFFEFDKLKVYSFLIFGSTLIVRFIYYQYCKKRYEECNFRFKYWDKSLFNSLISYSSWNIFGNIANLLKDQGVNLLLNIFYGPVVNAARGLSYQISTTINGFSLNFTTAVNPQIVKSFAKGDLKHMKQLVYTGSKFSYLLLMTISLPLIIETPYLLTIWLKNPPEQSAAFTRLVLIDALITSLSYTIFAAIQATARIKKYQVIISCIVLLNLPLSYIFLKMGYGAIFTFFIAIVISTLALLARLFLFKIQLQFSIRDYLENVLLKVFIVTVLSFSISYFSTCFFAVGFFKLSLTVSVSLFITFISSYFIALNTSERSFLNEYIKRKLFVIWKK